MRQSGDRKRLAKGIARIIGLTPSARRWHAAFALLAAVVLAAAYSVWSDRQREVEAQQARAAQLAAQAAQVAAKQAAVAQAKADQERAKADFAAKRPELIAAMRAALKRGDFAGVQRMGSPYLTYADAKFQELVDRAHAAEAAIDAKEEAAQPKTGTGGTTVAGCVNRNDAGARPAIELGEAGQRLSHDHRECRA